MPYWKSSENVLTPKINFMRVRNILVFTGHVTKFAQAHPTEDIKTCVLKGGLIWVPSLNQNYLENLAR